MIVVLFHLEGGMSLELEVQDDSIRLRPQQTAVEPAKLVRNKRGRLIIAGGPDLKDDDIIQAIRAERAEREVSIAAFRDK